MAIVGKIAFIIGLVIAVVAGFGFTQEWFPWVLAVLGLIVGFLNVGEEETKTFLLAAIGLLLSATAIATIPFVGETATHILNNLKAFIAAAVLIVALRALFATARSM